ncbi:MAG: PAS domain-containing protein [Candidatus Omnitrophota bacterium]|nr:PAS domain-containing protein [Candidatus Omnitrophota bacterium]
MLRSHIGRTPTRSASRPGPNPAAAAGLADVEPRAESLQLDLLAHIPSSILIFDAGLRVLFANGNFLLKSKREAHDTVGKRLNDIFPPAILLYTNLEERLRNVLRTGQRFVGGEMEFRAPGLAPRVYFYSLTPLGNAYGGVESVMLFMDDVTEKKNLGERVMRAERHLASVVESAYDVIISLDAEGAVMTWNSAAERILGFSSRQMVSRPFFGLFPERTQQDLKTLVLQVVREGEVQEMETGMTTKAGQEVLIAWRLSAMREDGGRVTAVVGVGRDLTEKRQLELRLIQSSKMAALGEMAGGIAHEVRNPQAIASAAAQILLKQGDDPVLRRECAEKIRAAATRAGAIIENLLKFARPSESLDERVDVNEALEDTLSLVGHQISLQSVEIEKRLGRGLPVVKGSKNQLQQVFMNVILNAYHAMPAGGKLTIETVPGGDGEPRGVEIRLTDTGCGIPEANLGRIFDPFFTTMPVGQGTGLGLALGYSIIRHHQGGIRVESAVGKGSTFTINLPALPES